MTGLQQAKKLMTSGRNTKNTVEGRIQRLYAGMPQGMYSTSTVVISTAVVTLCLSFLLAKAATWRSCTRSIP